MWIGVNLFSVSSLSFILSFSIPYSVYDCILLMFLSCNAIHSSLLYVMRYAIRDARRRVGIGCEWNNGYERVVEEGMYKREWIIHPTNHHTFYISITLIYLFL